MTTVKPFLDSKMTIETKKVTREVRKREKCEVLATDKIYRRLKWKRQEISLDKCVDK